MLTEHLILKKLIIKKDSFFNITKDYEVFTTFNAEQMSELIAWMHENQMTISDITIVTTINWMRENIGLDNHQALYSWDRRLKQLVPVTSNYAQN